MDERSSRGTLPFLSFLFLQQRCHWQEGELLSVGSGRLLVLAYTWHTSCVTTPSDGIPGNFLFSLKRTWDQHLSPGLMLLMFTTTQPSQFRFADAEQNSTSSLSTTS